MIFQTLSWWNYICNHLRLQKCFLKWSQNNQLPLLILIGLSVLCQHIFWYNNRIRTVGIKTRPKEPGVWCSHDCGGMSCVCDWACKNRVCWHTSSLGTVSLWLLHTLYSIFHVKGLLSLEDTLLQHVSIARYESWMVDIFVCPHAFV